MSLETAVQTLEKHGFSVRVFKTAQEASSAISQELSGKTIGFGGSVTLDQLGLFDTLSHRNTVFWHWKQNPADARASAANAAVYLSSVNALAETGEIVNIDGAGNRVASTLYGHKKVYLIISRNKLAADYDGALWRARNVAAPKNAQRLNRKTPCAIKGDRCYDCKSPDRICCGLVVLWRPMMGQDIEIILVDEDLGC